jgi:hypothetical protein
MAERRESRSYLHRFTVVENGRLRALASTTHTALACTAGENARTAQSWQDALVGSYPHLFHRSSSQAPVCRGIGEGWRETVELLVRRLADIVGTRPVAIVRISQKCGHLRIDTWADHAVTVELQMEMDYAIALAEARSACVCEQCGSEGLLYRCSSMLRTCCAEHATGDPVPVRRGMERLHLVRKIVGGRPGPISAGRYDRVTDAFVDVDPSTLELADPS